MAAPALAPPWLLVMPKSNQSLFFALCLQLPHCVLKGSVIRFERSGQGCWSGQEPRAVQKGSEAF